MGLADNHGHLHEENHRVIQRKTQTAEYWQAFSLAPADIEFGLPRFVKDRLRNHLTTRPVQIRERCILCGVCVRGCPPQVIRIEGKRLVFDYNRCIRCYCCRELCPEAALDVRKGILLKIFGGREG